MHELPVNYHIGSASGNELALGKLETFPPEGNARADPTGWTLAVQRERFVMYKWCERARRPRNDSVTVQSSTFTSRQHRRHGRLSAS